MSVKKLFKGFTILELMLSMMIFTIMGMTLYSMMDALTRLQTTSLGLQRYVNEGHNMLDKLATEISVATTEPILLVDPDNTSGRKTFTPQFICVARDVADTSGDLFFEGIENDTSPPNNHPDMRAKTYIQQLFYTVFDHNLSMDQASSAGVNALEEYYKKVSSGINWDDILVKERILYLTQSMQLALYVRKENRELNGANKVNGIAKEDKTGGLFPLYPGDFKPYQPFCPMPIYHIEYLFWGDKSKSWADDGVSGQPIRYWDSREDKGDIHQVNELPRAMKILLTLNYNPEMYDKREEHLDSNKDQLITLERVVVFKNYKNLEGV